MTHYASMLELQGRLSNVLLSNNEHLHQFFRCDCVKVRDEPLFKHLSSASLLCSLLVSSYLSGKQQHSALSFADAAESWGCEQDSCGKQISDTLLSLEMSTWCWCLWKSCGRTKVFVLPSRNFEYQHFHDNAIQQ